MSTATAWMSAEQFAAEQRRLRDLVRAHYRQLSPHDIEDIVSDALLQSWRQSTRHDTIDSARTWLGTVALNQAARHLKRNKHAHVGSLDAGGTLDHHAIVALGAGRQTDGDDPTAAQVAGRERLRVRSSLLAGLRRIHPRDVELFLDRTVRELSYAEIAARHGVTERRVRRALDRVSKFITHLSGLVDERLNEQEAIALALHHAKVAAPRERELAEQLLAGPDGLELHAAIAEAMHRAKAYLPVLVVADDPAREVAAPVTQLQNAPALWQRITDTLTTGRDQLGQWATSGKNNAANAALQYLPAGSGARPGAALGAALALCIGGGAVCVDQGVLRNPLAAPKAKQASVDRSVKAPKSLRAARPTNTSVSPSRAAAPASRTARLRAPDPPPTRRTAPPTSSPTPSTTSPRPTSGGGGGGNEFGGGTSEFGGGGGGAGAPTSGGNEFGSAGATGGGSSSGGGGGGGGEFGGP